MSKGQLRIAAAILSLGIVTAALLMMPRQRRPSTARAEIRTVLAAKTPLDVPTQQSGSAHARTDALVRLPSRPAANTASRNDRRSGFAWILRQLGASEEILDRLADGDLVASLKKLNQQAESGDPTAINILGFA